jgi:signal transduction histidine kinase
MSETDIDRISLRFSRPDLEQEFQRDTIRRFLPQTRVALLLALFLYAIFGALDPFVVSRATRFAWALRYGLGCPLIVLLFGLSFTRPFERWVHHAWVALALVIGLSIIAMTLKDSSGWSHLYYAGLTMIAVYIYTFVRVPFLAASVTSWGLALVYQVAAIATQAVATPVLVNNAIFLLAANVLGMSVCYSMERALRVEFLRRRLIDRQAAELRDALSDLEQKNAELDSFVYIASHDLKAPLVTIQGMSGLLLEEYGSCLNDDGRHLLERVDVNVRHMEQLILDLLALSRIGREAQPPEHVDVDLLVRQIADDFTGTRRGRQVALTVHPLPPLWAIPTHLEQVFTNLVGNAFKYLGDRPDATIEVGAVDHADIVEYYVRDSGIGIDPVYHAKVFEIFQRLRDADAEGTGVGLAIVKKIVEANGGRIWVESTRGAGATFRFTWRKAVPEGTAAPAIDRDLALSGALAE